MLLMPIKVTAIDENNNISTCQASISVIDDVAPDFDNLPNYINDITSGDNLPEQENLTATDDCGNATVIKSIDPYDVSNCDDYEITYLWTAINGCGNSSEITRSFNVLFNGDDLSVYCPQDMTIVLGEEGFVQLDPQELWEFNSECDYSFHSSDDLYFTCDDAGQHSTALSVMNNNQLLTTCNFNVTIDASNCESSTPLEYCESYGNSSGWNWRWIQSITLANYINWSGSDNGYGDYTGDVIEMAFPSSTNIAVDPTYDWSYFSWAIWIDFNQDGEFSDDEQVYSAYGRSTLNGSIDIPDNVTPGTTRMRVSMKSGFVPGPCDIFNSGEVEDYIMVDMSEFDGKFGFIKVHNSWGIQVWTSKKIQLSNTTYQIEIGSLDLPAGIYNVSVIHGKESVSSTIYINNE